MIPIPALLAGLRRNACLRVLLLVPVLASPLAANALPAFARQTGLQCATCHAGGQFPELTSFGRMFKLTGYTIGPGKANLAAMGVASRTSTAAPTADPAFAKDAVALFQTGSVFFAGKVADKVGIFAQATFDNYDSQDPGSGHWKGKWASDNFDLRYADHYAGNGQDLVFGLSLNNNPSVADPWNTSPAWMQYVPTQWGVTGPDASPVVAQLGQQVAGLGAYALWNQNLYLEVAGYQTANKAWSFLSQGIGNADQVKLRGTNPYLRVALTKDWGPNSAMLGMFAMNANAYPDNLSPAGPVTAFHDRGVDAQYQYLGDPNTMTAQLSYITESIANGDSTGVSANAHNRLRQLRLKGSYVRQAKYGAGLSYFSTTGSSDAVLYPDPAANPGTRGWEPELFWIPVQYLRVGAQYFMYDRFHGAKLNYDGAGRAARDNNTLFVYLWGAY